MKCGKSKELQVAQDGANETMTEEISLEARSHFLGGSLAAWQSGSLAVWQPSSLACPGRSRQVRGELNATRCAFGLGESGIRPGWRQSDTEALGHL